MMTGLRSALTVGSFALASVIAATAFQPTPAAASGGLFVAGDIRARTPSCQANPGAAVKGFAVGQIGTQPRRTFSFVGCFDSMAACQRWLGPTTGAFTGRIIQNRCEPNR